MSEAAGQEGRLPIGSIGRHASGWWGMIMLILTEAALFALLLFCYYYLLALYGRDWLPSEPPRFRLSLPNTLILLGSSVAVWLAERGIKRNSRPRLQLGLLVGLILGAAFVGIQVLEWMDKPFTLSSTSYGSVYFTVTGFHMAHVVGGLVMLAAMLLWSLLGYFDSRRHAAITVGAIYWHFVDAVWLTLFFTFYVTPYLG